MGEDESVLTPGLPQVVESGRIVSVI